MIISPGMTSFDGQNPGFLMLNLNQTSQIAYDLKFIFLPIEATLNWTQPFPSLQTWPWLELNFTEVVGLNEITPESIQQLHLRLKADQDLTKKYLTMKIGYNSSDPVQAFKAMEVYE
jgi:hypothetical protein